MYLRGQHLTHFQLPSQRLDKAESALQITTVSGGAEKKRKAYEKRESKRVSKKMLRIVYHNVVQ